MARPSGPKTRNGGKWTEPKFNNFIRNLLRGGTRKWGPKQEVKKEARVSRGLYLCAGCSHRVPATIKNGRDRVTNVFVDHIEPIVDPSVGFTNYDEYINRMFCEKDNLQLLCKRCHDYKSNKEKEIAKERRKREQNG